MDYVKLGIRKASQSKCRFKVCAIGLNSKGDLIDAKCNKSKIEKKGMGKHAEIELIKRHGRKIRKIILIRIGGTGNILPIDPCPTCSKIMQRYGIKWETIK